LRISDLSQFELRNRLADGLRFKVGNVHISISSTIPEVVEHFEALYCSYELLDKSEFIDFYIQVLAPSIFRRFFRPQVNFSFDGFFPFKPLPYSQAAAMFEWGLNWCITTHSHQYLMIHSSIVEKNGEILILPGASGKGKSTLCAALVCSGWRLYSDEMALIAIENGKIFAVPRPISLKNQSLNIIQGFSNDVVFGSTVTNTAKGDLAFMKVPEQSLEGISGDAIPSKIIFPFYKGKSATHFQAVSKGTAFMQMIENSFNYNALGKTGFEVLSKIIENCDCFNLTYDSLEEAVSGINRLGEK